MEQDLGPGASRAATEHTRIIRAELSRLIEPGDLLAGLALETFGAAHLHALIASMNSPSAQDRDALAHAASAAGLRPRHQDLRVGLERWRTRCGALHGAADLATMERLGGGLLVPEDPGWPAQLGDLGPLAPVALWYRGGAEESGSQALARLPGPTRAVAIVGSREVTDYGIRVTAEITQDLVQAGLCVVSGGAYGVDAAAHRAALRTCSEQAGLRMPSERTAAAGRAVGDVASSHSDTRHRCRPAPTLAVLAGGLDRFYPAGNEGLLREVAAKGLLLSEMAPGSAPTRHRFLQRNRLIAALGMATVITEARWRSGAQSTAHHALTLGREVAVVPGSVFSASSAGCHRLLRETPAQLVRDAADVLALVAGTPVPGDSIQPELPMLELPAPELRVPQPPAPDGLLHPQDGLDEAQRLLLDALPRRGLSSPGRLSSVAGLPLPTVLAELTRLQRSGHARTHNGHWGRA